MGGLATYAVDTINSSATKLFKDVFKFIIYFKNLVFQVTSLAFIASTKNVRVANRITLIANKKQLLSTRRMHA